MINSANKRQLQLQVSFTIDPIVQIANVSIKSKIVSLETNLRETLQQEIAFLSILHVNCTRRCKSTLREKGLEMRKLFAFRARRL